MERIKKRNSLNKA